MTIELSDINFVLMHVTTSADKCKGIKKNGLHDLVWSYEHETELRSFLDAYGIDIDINNRKICIEGVTHDIPSDIKKSGGVGYKFFDDPYVCGCFQMRKDSPYGGNVHLRPEIIYNINKLVKGADLEYSWMNTHQPYIVKFRVPYNKMMIFLSESASSSKDKILKTLFNAAFYTVFYNDFSSDRIGILKLGEYVPASDVISIEDY